MIRFVLATQLLASGVAGDSNRRQEYKQVCDCQAASLASESNETDRTPFNASTAPLRGERHAQPGAACLARAGCPMESPSNGEMGIQVMFPGISHGFSHRCAQVQIRLTRGASRMGEPMRARNMWNQEYIRQDRTQNGLGIPDGRSERTIAAILVGTIARGTSGHEQKRGLATSGGETERSLELSGSGARHPAAYPPPRTHRRRPASGFSRQRLAEPDSGVCCFGQQGVVLQPLLTVASPRGRCYECESPRTGFR